MDYDERRVEDTKKILKLGRWNIGLRKGLVDYDKGRYVEERNELFNQLSNRSEIEEATLIFLYKGTCHDLEDAKMPRNADQILVTRKLMISVVIEV